MVSLAAVVMVAVQMVEAGKGPARVRVATMPEVLTVPTRGVPAGQASEKLEVVRLAASIALLKVAVTVLVLIGTPVAFRSGVVAVTVGANCGSPPAPRIGSWPPPLPQPVAMTNSSKVRADASPFENLLNSFILIPFLNLSGKPSMSAEQPTCSRAHQLPRATLARSPGG